MKRFVSLSDEPRFAREEAVVHIRHELVSALALELILLKEGLAATVRLSGKTDKSVVLVCSDDERASKAKVRRQQGTIQFELGKNQVEYLQLFSLRAFRDGMADVNHVHIEGVDDGGSGFDLTLTFELFREPMSSAEAEELLADD